MYIQYCTTYNVIYLMFLCKHFSDSFVIFNEDISFFGVNRFPKIYLQRLAFHYISVNTAIQMIHFMLNYSCRPACYIPFRRRSIVFISLNIDSNEINDHNKHGQKSTFTLRCTPLYLGTKALIPLRLSHASGKRVCLKSFISITGLINTYKNKQL